jgi:hypothetical protein
MHEGSLTLLNDSVVYALATQTIDCPASGYVLAIGSCTMGANWQEDEPIDIGVGVSDHSGLDAADEKRWKVDNWADPSPTTIVWGDLQEIICVQKIFAVSAGQQTFWFNAIAYEHELGTVPRAYDRTLSLAFFPSGYGSVEE